MADPTDNGTDPSPNRSEVTWTEFLHSPAARSLFLADGDRLPGAPALVRDRGSPLIDAFDAIFRTDGPTSLKTPARTPVANTFAERLIGSIRRELLDRTIIWNRRQLERLVVDYSAHHNQHRPHQSLEQRPPKPLHEPPDTPPETVPVLRTSRCDGLIHEYWKRRLACDGRLSGRPGLPLEQSPQILHWATLGSVGPPLIATAGNLFFGSHLVQLTKRLEVWVPDRLERRYLVDAGFDDVPLDI